mgnify:CR=1 FL=1
MEYFEEIQDRVILIGVQADRGDDMEESLDELGELAATAGAAVAGRIIQNREAVHPGTYIGKGKIEEVKGLLYALDANGVICDDELSPAQMNNLERELECKVMDRTLLILDIFAKRAVTSEGKIQVELAQLRYRSARLVGLRSSLSRLGGGIGTRGPGEKKLETDRRLIRNRISALKQELSQVEKHRELIRSRRAVGNLKTAAIVGYTNAGKSSLLNTITGAEVLSYDKLFATLDSTTRKLVIPDGRELTLTDTVGFIQKLPTTLVEAFKSTLDEISGADLILHVVDASDPNFKEQIDTVNEVLAQIDADEISRIEVFNKIDLLDEEQLSAYRMRFPHALFTSTLTGEGIDELIKRIGLAAEAHQVLMEVLIPFTKGELVSLAHKRCSILAEEYTEEGTRMSLRVSPELSAQFSSYRIGEG